MPLSSTSKGWPLCHCQAHTTVSPPIHPTLFHRCQALLGCLGSPYLRRSNMKLYIPHNPRQHTHLCKVPSHLFRRQIRPSTPRILVMANVPMPYQWFDNEVIFFGRACIRYLYLLSPDRSPSRFCLSFYDGQGGDQGIYYTVSHKYVTYAVLPG